MHAASEWYVSPTQAGYGLYRDYYGNIHGTYIERFRLNGKPIEFQSIPYATRAAAHLNNLPTGARV